MRCRSFCPQWARTLAVRSLFARATALAGRRSDRRPRTGSLYLFRSRQLFLLSARWCDRTGRGTDLDGTDGAGVTLLWILAATFVGGALSAALASLFLLLRDTQRARLLPHLI